MSLPFQSGDSVKQALYEELQNILSPVKEVRTGAESRMKHLEFTEGEISSTIHNERCETISFRFL